MEKFGNLVLIFFIGLISISIYKICTIPAIVESEALKDYNVTLLPINQIHPRMV